MPTAFGTAVKATFTPIELEDDLYPAMIKDVIDSEGTAFETGEKFPQYTITFELLNIEDAKGHEITLLAWLKIPPTLISDGVVNENSNLYEFLKALGYEDDNLVVDPDEWQGKELRVNVENRQTKSGKNAGQTRPRITGYKPPKGKSAPAKAKPITRKTTTEDDF